MADNRDWPGIPYAPWAETCQALHLYSQIMGNYRLARTHMARTSVKSQR